jgi:hypothetical protein
MSNAPTNVSPHSHTSQPFDLVLLAVNIHLITSKHVGNNIENYIKNYIKHTHFNGHNEEVYHVDELPA